MLAAAVLLWPAIAAADGRGVLVLNHSAETIRQIHIAPAGSASPGENRLRSQLPPGAQARIGFSSGCTVDVRLGFDGGRTEEFLGRDACGDTPVVAGQGAAGATASVPVEHAAATAPAHGKAPIAPMLAAKVVVPPWHGHSITKKFGGLD